MRDVVGARRDGAAAAASAACEPGDSGVNDGSDILSQRCEDGVEVEGVKNVANHNEKIGKSGFEEDLCVHVFDEQLHPVDGG